MGTRKPTYQAIYYASRPLVTPHPPTISVHECESGDGWGYALTLEITNEAHRQAVKTLAEVMGFRVTEKEKP